MRRLPILKDGAFCYDIVFSDTLFDLGEELETLYEKSGLPLSSRQICIISDSNVYPILGNEVVDALKDRCKTVSSVVFPAGEENKNLATVEILYKHLINTHFTRKDVIVALGGGVTGDMAGFAAATYLRGVDFVQVPTTVLSMVDSSIGGKTAVDFGAFKNMVGAFHMPRLVFTDVAVLETLPARQINAGFGEIVKHGLIRDKKYLDNISSFDRPSIDSYMAELMMDFSGSASLDAWEEIIYGSDLIKKEVVEEDPTEQGIRALLNFGHTLGHAIEKASKFSLLHGECVALGCVAASYISFQRGMISESDYALVKELFARFDLPIILDNNSVSLKEVLENTKSDKKNASGTLKFVLLKSLGTAYIDTTVSTEEMTKALAEIGITE